MARKSKGRQKIEMTRMSKESNLLVTFSKRRSGLFKKAYELHTLCGAAIGIIVFSPGKKVFSYGHPSLYALIDRFLSEKSTPGSSGSAHFVEAHRIASIQELNSQLTEMVNQLEVERKQGEELVKIRKASQERCWWEAPAHQLGQQELEQLKMAMEQLKKNVSKHAEKLLVEASNATPFLGALSSNGAGGGGDVGLPTNNVLDAKVPPGLGLSMASYGFSLGYGRNL